MAKPYDQDFKERALRMLAEAMPEYGSVHAASKHIGGLLCARTPTRCGYGIVAPKLIWANAPA